MGFQIRDTKGEAIAINTLDKEIAVLWGVECRPKRYAVRNNRDFYPEGIKGDFDFASQSNWFDTIGYMIHAEGKSIQDLIDYYTDVMKEYLGKTDEDGSIITIEIIYPKIMLLLNTWLNKGYTSHQVDSL